MALRGRGGRRGEVEMRAQRRGQKAVRLHRFEFDVQRCPCLTRQAENVGGEEPSVDHRRPSSRHSIPTRLMRASTAHLDLAARP